MRANVQMLGMIASSAAKTNRMAFAIYLAAHSGCTTHHDFKENFLDTVMTE